MKKYVTVVIKYEDEDYPSGVSFGAGMLTEDLPDGSIVAVNFGNALEDDDDEH